MAEAAAAERTEAPARGRRGRGPLLGLLAALLLGGGGFFATYSGVLVLPLPGAAPSAAEPAVAPLGPVAFVALEKILVSLGPGARARHLQVTAELEVDPAHRDEVALLRPRILDVTNGYLRAVAVSDLEDPRAMGRIRAQLLRRIQIVTGEGRVRDLLFTEFVLN